MTEANVARTIAAMLPPFNPFFCILIGTLFILSLSSLSLISSIPSIIISKYGELLKCDSWNIPFEITSVSFLESGSVFTSAL